MPRKDSATAGMCPALDKSTFIPLYAQIYRALLGKIQSGEFQVGDLLDSEEELSRHFKVSRMTARHALHELKAGGYAISEKGRGTFVTRPKFDKNILHLQGFTEEIRRRGMAPSSKLLEQAVISPSTELAERLTLNNEAKVLHLKRLRLADNIPMALEESFIPLDLFPGLDRINFATDSLYRILRQDYGVRDGYADEVIEATAPSREEAEFLTISRRACVLSIHRLIMTTQGTPIESTCSRYRGDRYKISLRVPLTTFE